MFYGERLERMRASRQFGDGRFHNTSGATATLEGDRVGVMRDFFFRTAGRRPPAPLPLDDPRAAWASRPSHTLRTTWLGHSTLLLELDGVRVLTDPVFGERVSPVSFAGTRRFHPTPVRLDELPPLDAIVLSHDHYDHLCAPTMRVLATHTAPIVTSLGVGARLEALGVPATRIVELDWWQAHTLAAAPLRITATPSQHFSGRSLTDRNRTLWSSFVLESANHRVFFSGDTGLTDEFAEVGARFGAFDLVMLEIGAWHPSWGAIHLGPENALRAFAMLRGRALLPIHWGTFDLGLHAWDEPAETLHRLAATSTTRVLTPPLGHAFAPTETESFAPWWRGVGADALPAAVPASERRTSPTA